MYSANALGKISFAFLLIGSARGLSAQIVAEALSVFPVQTQSLEYDNLAVLRNLPAYNSLRQQFAGTILQQARLAVTRFGIREEQVDEIVSGSGPAGSYGLFGGSFSGSAAMKVARKRNMPHSAVNAAEIFCPGAGICLLFLEDSVAAFGNSDQLRTMLEIRQGSVTGLSSNRELADLIYATDRRAPVRGAAFESQLNTLLANAFTGTAEKNIDWARYSAFISNFAYSVNFDSKVHVSASITCKTSTEAALLRQMLGVLADLQSLTIQAGKDQTSTPFENLQVSSSDRIVGLKVDCPMPTP